MAISYMQEVIIAGPPKELRKLLPFWHENAHMAEKISYVHLSSSMNYGLPMCIGEASLTHPELVFLESHFCDTNGQRTIRAFCNGKYKELYDEKLENEIEEDYAELGQVYNREEFFDAWNRCRMMGYEGLVDICNEKGSELG